MIEVGDYARTSKGITKVTDVFLTNISEITGLAVRTDKPYGNVDIKNHSKNIIDLIEVGDYVNGVKVVNIINYEGDTIKVKQIGVNRDENCILKPLVITEKDIKSIVTKEQFEQAEYKIEEDK